MNADHFFWIDADDLHDPPPAATPPSPAEPTEPGSVSSIIINLLLDASSYVLPFSSIDFLAQFLPSINDSPTPISIGISKKRKLEDKLAESFAALPGLKALDLGMFSPPVLVGPSVVPTYLPSLRVYTYNITGPEHVPEEGGGGVPDGDEDEGVPETPSESEEEEEGEDAETDSTPPRRHPHR